MILAQVERRLGKDAAVVFASTVIAGPAHTMAVALWSVRVGAPSSVPISMKKTPPHTMVGVRAHNGVRACAHIYPNMARTLTKNSRWR